MRKAKQAKLLDWPECYKKKTINKNSVLCYDTDDMILVCQDLLITTAEHGFFCESLKLLCFLLDGGLFLKIS